MKTKQCYETHTSCNGPTCNQFKHSEGAWRAVGRYIWSSTRCVAMIRKRGQTDVFKDEDEANANLVAAAPELLEACRILAEKCATAYPYREYMDDEVELARAAIAKAVGGAS